MSNQRNLEALMFGDAPKPKFKLVRGTGKNNVTNVAKFNDFALRLNTIFVQANIRGWPKRKIIEFAHKHVQMPNIRKKSSNMINELYDKMAAGGDFDRNMMTAQQLDDLIARGTIVDALTL